MLNEQIDNKEKNKKKETMFKYLYVKMYYN